MAQARLTEFLKSIESDGATARVESRRKMTFAEPAGIHLRNLDDNMRIKPRTRHYWRQRLDVLVKSWPGLNETEIRKITQADCKKWASSYAKIVSPTNYNNTVAILRHVFNVAVEAGVVSGNAA